MFHDAEPPTILGPALSRRGESDAIIRDLDPDGTPANATFTSIQSSARSPQSRTAQQLMSPWLVTYRLWIQQLSLPP
jgi:hypothetical protein